MNAPTSRLAVLQVPVAHSIQMEFEAAGTPYNKNSREFLRAMIDLVLSRDTTFFKAKKVFRKRTGKVCPKNTFVVACPEAQVSQVQELAKSLGRDFDAFMVDIMTYAVSVDRKIKGGAI